MIINKTNIKTLAGISVSTYDSKIDLLISSYLDQICEYCNNDFIARNINGRIYQYLSSSITATTITLTTTLTLKAGDFIRLYNTDYNDGMYQIKTFTNGVITIESAKVMNIETVSNMMIALVELPISFINILISLIKAQTIYDSNISSEKLKDVAEYTYFNRGSNDIRSYSNELGKYRLLYKQSYDSLFGGD